MTQINRRKSHKNVITGTRGRYRGKLEKGQSPHLKYHPQLKTKEDVEGEESEFWEVTRKSTVNTGKVVMHI